MGRKLELPGAARRFVGKAVPLTLDEENNASPAESKVRP